MLEYTNPIMKYCLNDLNGHIDDLRTPKDDCTIFLIISHVKVPDDEIEDNSEDIPRTFDEFDITFNNVFCRNHCGYYILFGYRTEEKGLKNPTYLNKWLFAFDIAAKANDCDENVAKSSTSESQYATFGARKAILQEDAKVAPIEINHQEIPTKNNSSVDPGNETVKGCVDRIVQKYFRSLGDDVQESYTKSKGLIISRITKRGDFEDFEALGCKIKDLVDLSYLPFVCTAREVLYIAHYWRKVDPE
ncbi:hypothetical protein RF11_08393 [Thelohanellus kitauei]|uniref:Uncharacterized protein n=1 Tax=Thelohanellus kitauei TaxID=669202 RepID=A0A0C2JE75_THEKT|nr:hypothetical protein RF11_08393 [Thelohanellus kitauei]